MEELYNLLHSKCLTVLANLFNYYEKLLLLFNIYNNNLPSFIILRSII